MARALMWLAVAATMLFPAGGVRAAASEGDGPQPPATRAGAEHAVPLYGSFLRPWDAPDDDPYAPGHRGVDIGAAHGAPVHASAGGAVSFAGVVAGNRTVTVDHGAGLLTTYSYLDGLAVETGEQVEQGQIVGTVGDGHPGSEHGPHVHLSARRDGTYFDPLSLYIGDDHSDLLALVA